MQGVRHDEWIGAREQEAGPEKRVVVPIFW
jgi:hypothetical protein